MKYLRAFLRLILNINTAFLIGADKIIFENQEVFNSIVRYDDMPKDSDLQSFVDRLNTQYKEVE